MVLPIGSIASPVVLRERTESEAKIGTPLFDLKARPIFKFYEALGGQDNVQVRLEAQSQCWVFIPCVWYGWNCDAPKTLEG